MTYLITPYHEAYSIDDDASFFIYETDTYCVVQMPKYRRSHDMINISPKYIFEDYKEDDDDNGKDASMYEAVKWLEDLLIRLSKNPVVINCTSDGEMFVRG